MEREDYSNAEQDMANLKPGAFFEYRRGNDTGPASALEFRNPAPPRRPDMEIRFLRYFDGEVQHLQHNSDAGLVTMWKRAQKDKGAMKDFSTLVERHHDKWVDECAKRARPFRYAEKVADAIEQIRNNEPTDIGRMHGPERARKFTHLDFDGTAPDVKVVMWFLRNDGHVTLTSQPGRSKEALPLTKLFELVTRKQCSVAEFGACVDRLHNEWTASNSKWFEHNPAAPYNARWKFTAKPATFVQKTIAAKTQGQSVGL